MQRSDSMHTLRVDDVRLSSPVSFPVQVRDTATGPIFASDILWSFPVNLTLLSGSTVLQDHIQLPAPPHDRLAWQAEFDTSAKVTLTSISHAYTQWLFLLCLVLAVPAAAIGLTRLYAALFERIIFVRRGPKAGVALQTKPTEKRMKVLIATLEYVIDDLNIKIKIGGLGTMVSQWPATPV